MLAQSSTFSTINRASIRRISQRDSKIVAGDVIISVPPDGGWGWVIVVASFITAFVSDGTVLTYGMFIKEISTDFNIHPTKAAIASSVLTGFCFLWGPVVCGMVNRFGFRCVGFVGAILATTTLLTSSVAMNFPLFIVVYGMMGGLGFGMMYVPSLVAVTYYFERWRALAVSCAVCGAALGVMCYPLIVHGLVKRFQWRTNFRILAIAGVPCGLCALTYLPLKPVKIRVVDENRINDESEVFPLDYMEHSVEGAFLAADLSIPQIKLGSSSSFVISIRDESTLSVIPDMGPIPTQKTTIWSKLKRCLKCCCFCTNCRSKCCKCRCRRNLMRPMYRDDIFFTGSLYTLPEYSGKVPSLMVKKSTLDYHLSVTRLSTQYSLTKSDRACCPEALRGTLGTMLDFSLMKSPSFVILLLSGFFSVFGMYIPYIYMIERAKEKQMDEHLSTYLLSVLGLANCVGRIICGIISSFRKVKILVVSYATLVLCGIMAIISVFLNHIYGQFVFCAIYGLSLASLPCLKASLIVEMLGLEKLTNALGIVMVFQGVSSFLSLPLAGALYDLVQSYDVCFVLAGVLLILGGLCLVPIKAVTRWELAKRQRPSGSS